MNFYAVVNGRQIGVFLNWAECKESVLGYGGAIYKKFDTREKAEEFIETRGIIEMKSPFTSPFTSQSTPQSTSQSTSQSTEPDYYVYTDGACTNNGKVNARAGIGIFFGPNDPRNVSQSIGGKQTNNAAELSAIIYTYSLIKDDIRCGKHVTIVTDSEYCIKCLTTYGSKCSAQNWTKDIPNKDLVKLAYELYADNTNIQFLHVAAHTGKSDPHSVGNDGADRLANKACGLQ
jgi:ribonuclease HI